MSRLVPLPPTPVLTDGMCSAIAAKYEIVERAMNELYFGIVEIQLPPAHRMAASCCFASSF